MRKPMPAVGWRRPLELLGQGMMFVLKPLQIVSNFVFLAVAYVLGVGLSALMYRLGGKRAGSANPQSPNSSYWRELPPASRDRESWLRPF